MNLKKLRLASAIAIAATALACAGFLPVRTASSEKVFEIPHGTWARRMNGEPLPILPDEIRLTLGIQDVLLLKNSDEVPQMFGPTLIMPGQSFRLPFGVASDYQFACAAHASGQMTVIVEPFPSTPWARIGWRARRAGEHLERWWSRNA